LQLLDEHPDWYLEQFAAEFGACRQAVQKRFAALGVTRKKKLLPILESPKKKGSVFEAGYAHTRGKPRIWGRMRNKAD
jgi:hypothetical protein